MEPANSPEVRALVLVVMWSLVSALWELRVREAATLGNVNPAVSQATSSAAIDHKLIFPPFYRKQQHISQDVVWASCDYLQAHRAHGMGALLSTNISKYFLQFNLYLFSFMVISFPL